MEDLNPEQQQVQKTKKPGLLKVLTILSLVYIGSQFLRSIFLMLIGPQSRKMIEDAMVQTMKIFGSYDQTSQGREVMEQSIQLQLYIQNNLYVHCLANIAILGLGLYGVISMMMGKKRGFHLYICYSLAEIASVYVSVPASEVPVESITSGLVLSLIFVFLYARNLHWLRD